MENLRENWFGIDGQGNLNVFFDDSWENVVTTTVRGKRQEIIGCNLNTLLRGLILLFGLRQLQDKIFLGGVFAWEEIVEPAYISLPQLCMEETTTRLIYLQRACLSGHNSVATSIIFEGTVSFLYFWIANYKFYLHESNYILLLSVLAPIMSQLSKVEKLDLSKETMDRLEYLKSCYFVQRSTPQCHLLMSVYNQPLHHRVLEPNAAYIEGKWNGKLLVEQKEQLKAKMASLPQIKLEIFGADMLIDNLSDDDEDNGNFTSTTTKNESTMEEIINYPLSRITTGFSLLKSPLLMVESLMDIDMAELARQWTLADYFLFRELSLNSLVSNCFSANKVATRPKIHESLKYGGIKRIVDRFNGASLWVSTQIILGSTPGIRTHLISKFVELAREFVKLRNFHGLMTVLTALQQGCISRLFISFDLLSVNDKAEINNLKKLMAGGKNYANYREELLKLMNRLEDTTKFPDWKSDVSKRKFGNTKPGNQITGDNSDTSATIISLCSPGGNGIIPHLAAHVAALTAITECHTDYLPEYVHLFNITKWKLCHQIIKPIERLQHLEYSFMPIRSIIAALHFAWKNNSIPNHELSTINSTENIAKDLFLLSEKKESNDMIAKFKVDKLNTTVVPVINESASIRTSEVEPQYQGASNETEKKKYTKSNAYDRIRQSVIERPTSINRAPVNIATSASSSSDSENDASNSEDSSSEEEQEKSSSISFIKRFFTFGKKRSIEHEADDNDRESSDEESASQNESTEEKSSNSADENGSHSVNEEEDDDDDETNTNEESVVSKKSKAKKLLQNIARAFKFG